MKRLAALFIVVPWLALAQTQCPGSNASFSGSLPSPLQFFTYDLIQYPNTPSGVLTVVGATTVNIFVGVPQNVAQNLQYAANQTQFYNNSILPVYHQLFVLNTATVITKNSNCPLQLSGTTPGFLWTK
jgi:hypothetical protein